MGSLMVFASGDNEIGMAFGNLEIIEERVTRLKPTWYQWRLRWESPDLLISWSTDPLRNRRVAYAIQFSSGHYFSGL